VTGSGYGLRFGRTFPRGDAGKLNDTIREKEEVEMI